MIKFSINNRITHLPLRKAKGTVEERFQRAVRINDRFYDSIKDALSEKTITPLTYERKLKKAIGDKNIQIKVDEFLPAFSPKDMGGNSMPYIDGEFLSQQGYSLSLPFNAYERLDGRNIKTFMHQNLHLLERILNPKYNARFISLANKRYDIKAIDKFFADNLYTKTELNPARLKEFLQGKDPQEKIETLQYLRYQLMLEKHAHEYIEKNLPRFKEVFAKDSQVEFRHTAGKYRFDEKIKALEDELKTAIAQRREEK